MLEGGVGWACNLVTDLVGHWERRRRAAMESQTAPDQPRPGPAPAPVPRVRRPRLRGQDRRDLRGGQPGRAVHERRGGDRARVPQEQLRRLRGVPVTSGEELRRHFAERFYFGCEADDPMTAWAFDRHGHHRLNPIFSSDVGHFDVLDMIRGAGGGVGAGGARADHRGRLPRVRLRQPGAACTPRSIPTSSRAPWSRTRWPSTC